MTDEVVDLNAHRWDVVDDPAEHKPKEALRAALRFVDREDVNPSHVIIMIGYTDDDGDELETFMQGGSFSFREIVGLIECNKARMFAIGRD